MAPIYGVPPARTDYSWKDILADADSIAAADLSPIVNVQLMTAAGKAKELTAG